MEAAKENLDILDLISGPCFRVKNQKIIKVNQSAAGLFLKEGMELAPLLSTGAEEYASFSDGCLYLTLKIAEQSIGATVVRVDGSDVFLLEQDVEQAELRALSLAAMQLRKPLSNVMLCSEHLAALQTDPDAREQSARLNRGLAQLMRIIGNMSDASRQASRQELLDICGFCQEVFEKAQALITRADLDICCQVPSERIYCLIDPQELERAILNLFSNALKYTPAGGTIRASLTRQGHTMYLQMQDSGSGIADEIRGTVFRRFLRQPGIEDARSGIGLGMVLVRSTAAHHGGTVLIDQPNASGTRITLTLTIRQNADASFHSPVMRVDYTGGWDHALIELSDSLPPELYEIK